MERYTNGMCKVYFAEFSNKKTGEVFYKIGYTSYKDALDRFKIKGKQYESWDIRILSTIFCESTNMAKVVENTIREFYPKNFWLEEKISGVTEIFKVKRPEYLELLARFRRLNDLSKSLLGFK
jgi:hypothetical protein